MAVGVIGIAPSEFLAMTPREFFWVLDARASGKSLKDDEIDELMAFGFGEEDGEG